MRFLLFTIYDTKTEATAGHVMQYRHLAEALRAFHQIASDPQTLVNRHVRDFALYKIGELDDTTMTIEPQKPLAIITGQEYLDSLPPADAGDQLDMIREARRA